MKNPFEYGGVVGGSAFCNRKKELSDPVRAMENSESSSCIPSADWERPR